MTPNPTTQWIQYGNDSHLGSDRDLLIGNHTHGGRFMVQGTTDPANPPYMCTGLRNFVELRGGDLIPADGIVLSGAGALVDAASDGIVSKF